MGQRRVFSEARRYCGRPGIRQHEHFLWDIKVTIGDYYTWLQREGLKNARKCWAQAKAIAKKAATGKISREEACKQIDMLGFEK